MSHAPQATPVARGELPGRRCGLGLGSPTLTATWRFPDLSFSWEGPRCGASCCWPQGWLCLPDGWEQEAVVCPQGSEPPAGRAQSSTAQPPSSYQPRGGRAGREGRESVPGPRSKPLPSLCEGSRHELSVRNSRGLR